MKTINIPLEDKDYKKLKEKKGKLSWRAFILKLKENEK